MPTMKQPRDSELRAAPCFRPSSLWYQEQYGPPMTVIPTHVAELYTFFDWRNMQSATLHHGASAEGMQRGTPAQLSTIADVGHGDSTELI